MGATTDPLAGEKYLRLVTYKRDGTPVGTALWFAEHEGHYLAETGSTTWKVKRIRNNPSAMVSACDMRGRPHGPERHATVRLLDPRTDGDGVERKLNAKYGVVRSVPTALLHVVQKLRYRSRPNTQPRAYLEITLD